MSSTIRMLSLSLFISSSSFPVREVNCELGKTWLISVTTSSERINSVVSSKCFLPFSNLTVKRLPSPALLCRLILPWCISMSSFTRDKPMPVLDWLKRFLSTRLSNLVNNELCLFSGIPIPWSSTEMAMSLSESVITTFISLPCGVYLKALDSKLNNIFSSLSTSAQTLSEDSGDSILKSIWCSSAR